MREADLAFASSARVAGPLSRADLAFASSARVAGPLSRADLAFASSARVAVPLSPLSRADLAAAGACNIIVKMGSPYPFRMALSPSLVYVEPYGVSSSSFCAGGAFGCVQVVILWLKCGGEVEGTV